MRRFELIGAVILMGAVLASLAGCEGDERPSTAAKSGQATAASTQPTASELANVRDFVKQTGTPSGQALPGGHPPIGNPPAMPIPGGATPGAATTALKYKAPEAWQKEPVSSSMRVDQYRLPRAEGDSEDGELAILAGIGGGVDENVRRWRMDQFSTADGQPIPDEAFKRESQEVHGLRVTLVDISGRYAGGMTMSGSTPAAKDNWRMLAAIVETPGGLWFFKATGPAATMTKHRDEFLALIQSLSD